jgi:hypothetical protein
LANEVRIAIAKEGTHSKPNPSSSTLANEIQPLACLRYGIERVREKREEEGTDLRALPTTAAAVG